MAFAPFTDTVTLDDVAEPPAVLFICTATESVLVGVATTFDVTEAEQVEVATVSEASVARMSAVYTPFVPYVAVITVLVLPATLASPDQSKLYGLLPPVGLAVQVTTLPETLLEHVTASGVVDA